jgi:CRP-like cAMP-binding protein
MKELNKINLDPQSLKKIRIFRFVKDEELKKLVDGAEYLEFNDQETIIQEGEISHYFYAVLEGSTVVNVNKQKSEKAPNAYICTIGEGEVFGEAGLFIRVKRTANVLSFGNSKILRFKRDFFFEFIGINNHAGISILIMIIYSMLKKLRDANQELAFERSEDVTQDDIDNFIYNFIENK